MHGQLHMEEKAACYSPQFMYCIRPDQESAHPSSHRDLTDALEELKTTALEVRLKEREATQAAEDVKIQLKEVAQRGGADGDEEDGLMLSGRGGQRRRAHPAKWQAYGTVGGGMGLGEGARQAAGGWRLARRRARRLCRRCWLSLGADDVLGRGAVCTPEMRVGFMLLGTLLLAVLVRWAVWAADAAGGASGTGTIDAGGGGAGAGAGVVAAAAGGGVLVNATNATNALPSLSGGGGTGFQPI